MSTGTAYIPFDELINRTWNPAGTAPATNPDSVNVFVAGGFPLVGSGSAQPVTGQGFIAVQGLYKRFQLDGTTTATGSATGTTTTGLGGFSAIDVYVRFSSMTGTVSTVDVYIDSRLDGTNYANIAHVTQVTSATGATFDSAIHLQKAAGTNVETKDFRADAGAGTVRTIAWGDDLRIRRDISGGTTAPIFSYTVWVNALS